MQPKLRWSSIFGYVVVVAALLFPALLAAAQNRVVQAIENSESRVVEGNVHRLAHAEFDQGKAAGSMMLHRMVLTFKPSAAQQADLEALLSEQQNPLSPYYQQWLTPEQYASRFGLSASDVAKVVEWLEARGFDVIEAARSRTYVAFSGTATQVESVFGAEIHRYLVNGEAHYANVSDPSLPAPLANVALAFHGLNDFRPRPRAIVRRSARPEFTSSISGNHFLAPDDFATIYNLRSLYNSGIDGSGQTIAVTGQTDLVMSDISTFRSVSGLAPNPPTVRLVPGSADPGVRNDDLVEADLDVEWAGAVARNANIIYVNSTNVFGSMQYAVSQNVAPVISISYGDCEQNFSTAEINSLVAMGQQANAQGQTIVGPSGDSGAADCDYPLNANTRLTSATHGLAVDIPAALPYVTGAGGTTFNEGSGIYWSATNNASNGSALSYIPEVGWNDTSFELANNGSIAASGGGVSTRFAKPNWQTGTGVPNDGQRDVPDISFAASFDHDGYLICSNGSCVNGYRASDNTLFVVGGTSVGAPVFAGIVALINQQTGAAQGNVNPRLYQLAGTSTDAFHDSTNGDNKVPCTAGTTNCPSGTTQIGFAAGPGYDLVTGLGSVNAFNLVTEWNGSAAPPPPDFSVTATNSAATAQQGATAQYTLTIVSANNFVGTVVLATSGLPTGATAAFNPGLVSVAAGSTQAATLQVATTSTTPVGTYSLTLTATGGGLTHTQTLSLVVTADPDFQIGLSTTSMTLTAGGSGNTGSATLNVGALNGFAATVSLTCTVASTLPGTSCGVSPNSVSGSGTATVTITAPTTRAGVRAPRLLPRLFPWTEGSFAIAMGLIVAGNRARSSRKKKLRKAILAVLLMVALAMMIACGGGSSSSSSSSSSLSTVQTGTVTVTATSGTLTHTAIIAVTVN
jgi:subtilase family serine protease